MTDDLDQQIAAFYDAVKRKAREEVEIETGQAKALEEHGQATLDQQKAELANRAKLLGTYFTQLQANGVDPDTAMWLLQDEADWQRECG